MRVACLFQFFFVLFVCLLEGFPGGGERGQKRTRLKHWGARALLGCRAVDGMEGLLAVCTWSGLPRPPLPLA